MARIHSQQNFIKGNSEQYISERKMIPEGIFEIQDEIVSQEYKMFVDNTKQHRLGKQTHYVTFVGLKNSSTHKALEKKSI